MCAIAFQAATPFGRFEVDNKDNEGVERKAPRKLRMPEILKLIEEQAGVSQDLFFPVGEGSPLCNTFSLAQTYERWL